MTMISDLQEAIGADPTGPAVTRLVRAALREVAAGRRAVAAVRHPLGFVCLPVERLPGSGVCIHLWTGGPPDEKLTTSPVHSHSWDLVSQVLYGTVGNELVEVEEPPAGRAAPTHRLFEVHSAGDLDRIRRTDRLVRYRSRGRTEHGAGETYQIPAGTFHLNVVPAEQTAATVVLAHYRPQVADLSLGGLDTASHTVCRRHCDRAGTLAASEQVLRRLGPE